MGNERSVSDVVMQATRALVGVAAQSIAEVSDEVSLAQYRALVLVHSQQGVTMGELAELLGVNRSTATRMCDILEDKGLVVRAPDQENRRIVRVTLTATGRSLVRGSLRRREHLLTAAIDRLSPDAQRRLRRSLAEFTDALGASGQHAWALGWPHPIFDDAP